MKKKLVIRLMPAIYLDHRLVLRQELNPEYDLAKREVYLPNVTDLDLVLFYLKELMLTNPKFLFCLVWGKEGYYFERDGGYTIEKEKPVCKKL